MHAGTPKRTRVIVTAACGAAVILIAFLAGTRVGSIYERYRFIYAAPKAEAMRGAFARLLGEEESFGQFYQDLWVTRGVAPGKRNGYYLDVGSADGVRISNTKLLDDLGWKGICIDPFPTNMRSRTCKVFRQPVSRESGKHVEFFAAGDVGHISDNPGADHAKEPKTPMVEFVTATLDEILAKAHAPHYIDYMNLDVEGAELDALLGLSLDQYRIGSMTIEHNYDLARRDAIHRLLAAKGYVRVRSWEVDDWYVHSSLAPRYKDFIAYCGIPKVCPY